MKRRTLVLDRSPAGLILTRAALALLCVSALGQVPVISSFGQNGELICTNLQPGSVATVEWAPSVNGPWTNTWEGLDAVTVDSKGAIRVKVPMFYRVVSKAGPVPPSSSRVLIPAGSLTMGNPFDPSEGWADERPVHTVNVSAFNIDDHEVTYALWDEVYQWALAHGYSFDNPGKGKAANHPVQQVNWYDCVKWCNARSEKEERVPAYYTSAAKTSVYRTGQVDVQNDWVRWNAGYRLPTEAEWERAARGGLEGRRFPWGDTISHTQANYNSRWEGGKPFRAYDVSPTQGYHPAYATVDWLPYTSPVGSFEPNGYGLYDMAGNVSEWCWDWYSSSYYGSSPSFDPRGPSGASSYRVHRGGGWDTEAWSCRISSRDHSQPIVRSMSTGFRSVLPVGQP